MDDKDEFIKKLTDAFDKVGTTFAKTSKTFDDFAKEVNNGKRSILTMGPALKDMKEKLEDQRDEVGKLIKGSKKHKEATAQLTKTQEAYDATMRKFIGAQVMNGLVQAIVTGGAAFINGSREMAFTAIQGMQSGMDSITLGADLFTKEIERNANIARAAFEATAQAGAAIPLKFGLAAELAGKAGVELTNQVATLSTKGVQVLSTELSKTKASFTEMSKTGAFFAGGMTEMRNSAFEAGLRLDDYTKVVNNAGSSLRLFGVNQADAMAKVGKVTNAMGAGVNLQLRNMGYTQADIAEGTADYMAMLARTGTLSGKSQEALAKESTAYLGNLKLISAITGEDAKAAQKRATELAQQSAVQAKLAEMGPEATEKFQALAAQFPGIGKELQQLILTGTTDNAMLMNSPAFAAIKQAVADIGDDSVRTKDMIIGAQNTLNSTRDAQMQYNRQFKSIGTAQAFGAQVGEIGNQMQGLVSVYNQSARSGTDLSKQLDAQGNTTDATTNQTMILQQEMEKASRTLEKDLTPSLAGFANQLRDSFKDVEKYVKAALALMVDTKGAKTNPFSYDTQNNEQWDEAEQMQLWGNQAPQIGAARGAVLSGPTSGYKPNLTMHGTEAIVPLASGGVPIESPVLKELTNLLKAQTANAENNPALQAPQVIAAPQINLTPLVEKLSESNQLLKGQLEMARQMRASIEDGTAINKQILSVAR